MLRSQPPPADTDHDGMPDDWELRHGLNSKNPADGAEASAPGGYTHLEDYLNSLVPRRATESGG